MQNEDIIGVPKHKTYFKCYICDPDVGIDDSVGFYLCAMHYGTYAINSSDIRCYDDVSKTYLFLCTPFTFAGKPNKNFATDDNFYEYIFYTKRFKPVGKKK